MNQSLMVVLVLGKCLFRF